MIPLLLFFSLTDDFIELNISNKFIKVDLEGSALSLPVEGILKAKIQSGELFTNISSQIYLDPLFQRFQELIPPKVNKHDDCGERINISNVIIRIERGSIELDFNVDYEKWFCEKRLGLKTKLISQRGSATVVLFPKIIDERQFLLSGKVVKVTAPSQLGEVFEDQILKPVYKDFLQGLIDKQILKFEIPSEFEAYHPRIKKLSFSKKKDNKSFCNLDVTLTFSPMELVKILSLFE